MNITEKEKFSSMNSNTNKISNIGVFSANLTQRRPRKSTLGNCARRESKLITLEPERFSIHKESKVKNNHNNSLNELEEAVREAENELALRDSKTVSSLKSNSMKTTDESKLSSLKVKNNTFNDNVETTIEQEDEFSLERTLTELSQNTPVITRKRNCNLFSDNKIIGGGENSFIDRKQSLIKNNNNSYMHTTLVPENIVSNNIVKEKKGITVAATNSKQINCSFEKSILCDIPKQLDVLCSVVQKNSLMIAEYNNQIEELKSKINECNKENKTLESIKLILKDTIKTGEDA